MRVPRKLLFIVTALATAAATTSCNLTGGIDSSKGHDEMLNDALTKLDAGNCGQALSILTSISPQDDPVLEMTGKAQLCNAGAPMGKVVAALAGYSGNASSTDFTVIGNLANAIVPVPAGADATIASALASFKAMSSLNPLERGLWIIYADLVRIAALMAKNSASQTMVVRSDIAPAACINDASNCALSANCTAGMSNGDAGTAATAFSDANTTAASVSLGSVNTLLSNINTQLGSTYTATPTRCILFNQALTH